MKGWVSLVGWPIADGLRGHSSTAGRAQDMESSPTKNRRSATLPRHQPCETADSTSIVRPTYRQLLVAIVNATERRVHVGYDTWGTKDLQLSSSDVLLVVLGYDCGVNNPCTWTNEGSYLPHVNPSTYIVCGTAAQCTEVPCPVNTIWDQQVSACVNY